MTVFRSIIATMTLLLVTACITHSPATPVTANDLFQVNKESVNLPLFEKEDVEQAIVWIQSDAPSEITLTCQVDSGACPEMEIFLQDSNINYEKVAGDDGIILTYNRVEARECISGFGCALAKNHVHMVTDHEQFLSPALSGASDAASAVESYYSVYGR